MRKAVSGPVRNKERTKAQLIKTVGKMIKTGGFQQLKVSKIAEVAGVDKKLIYEYFGSVDELVSEISETTILGVKFSR